MAGLRPRGPWGGPGGSATGPSFRGLGFLGPRTGAVMPWVSSFWLLGGGVPGFRALGYGVPKVRFSSVPVKDFKNENLGAGLIGPDFGSCAFRLKAGVLTSGLSEHGTHCPGLAAGVSLPGFRG